MIRRELVQFQSGKFLLTGQWDGPWNDLPDDNPTGARPGVIFCHGFTGNRFESRRLFARLSADLAAAGYWTFRFDHRGCGDSQGDFADFTATGLLEDLRAALAVFLADGRADNRRSAVVGFSLGGLSASYLLSQYPDFVTGALWAPVAQPDIIRDRLATYPGFEDYLKSGHFDYMGTRVSAGYIDEIGRLEPVKWAKSFARPLLFTQAEGDVIVKPAQVRMYLEARANPADELLMISGGDHFFGRAENGDRVRSRTFAWLEERLRNENRP